MQVSSGFPHILTSNHRGLGQEPVIVAGNIKSAVNVNKFISFSDQFRDYSGVITESSGPSSFFDGGPTQPAGAV